MKILRQGIIETSVCTCDRCQAKLEYTTADIIGTGKIIPIEDSSDWVDHPIIQDSWPKYVKEILKKYGDDYVAYGYFAKRDGYIECPCCGQKIEFNNFPVQTEVYPGEAVSEDGEIIRDKVISIPGTVVQVLKEHYNEFNHKRAS